MARNPYRTVEKTLKGTATALYILLFGGPLAFGLFVWPFIAFSTGEAWHSALALWIVLVGLAVIVLLTAGGMWLVDKYIVIPWKRDKASWDEGHRS